MNNLFNVKNVITYFVDRDGQYHSLGSYFLSVKRKKKIKRIFNEENVSK